MRIKMKIDEHGSIWVGYPYPDERQMFGFNPAITGETLAIILADRFGIDMRNTPFWVELTEEVSND